jgi:hypothetical protein
MAISFDSSSGNIRAGGDNTDGDLILRSNAGDNRIRLDAGGGNAWLGGHGADGDLVLFPSGGDNITLDQSTIHLDGGGGNLWLGGNGADGDIVMRSSAGADRIRLDAGGGNLWLGGNGADGDIVLFAASGDNNTLAQATIHLNGDAGDIILQNADCAEEFDIEDYALLDPGTVVVIGAGSRLRMSDQVYDKRVAGIIAGAGGLKPGIILGRSHAARRRLPIALMGRVFCKTDTSNGTIEVGDLLTTSATPGHAMKASDPMRAFGAVIGKALQPLSAGADLIPVLVALQ